MEIGGEETAPKFFNHNMIGFYVIKYEDFALQKQLINTVGSFNETDQFGIFMNF